MAAMGFRGSRPCRRCISLNHAIAAMGRSYIAGKAGSHKEKGAARGVCGA